jgi:inner membrane protein
VLLRGEGVEGRTHLAVGVGIGVIGSFDQPLEHIPIILLASGVASLAADLDANNLLNKHVTKTVKHFKKVGMTLAIAIMVLAVAMIFIDEKSLPILQSEWLTLQHKLILLSVGAVVLGFSFSSHETLKNIIMSIIGLILIYYAATIELWWLVMLAFFIGGAGWFSHRGATHTVWALSYWGLMSYLLEQNTGIERLTLISVLAYLSHIIGDMLTKRGVKFLYPFTKKVFRFK